MERYCHNCNSLVTGTGDFCPTCGRKMTEGVNLVKDAQPQGQYNQQNTANTYNYGAPANDHAAQYVYTGGQNAIPTPVYQAMTIGQWVGTILLTTCLGIVSIILLFVWGFSESTTEPKKTYCKAMLIVYAISVGLAILWCIICFAFAFSMIPFME